MYREHWIPEGSEETTSLNVNAKHRTHNTLPSGIPSTFEKGRERVEPKQQVNERSEKRKCERGSSIAMSERIWMCVKIIRRVSSRIIYV